MTDLRAYTEQQAAWLLAELTAAGRTITFAESCTGGLLAAAFTANDGASAALKRAFVTYCDAAKADMLGVSPRVLAEFTAVSAPVAAQMAAGARRAAGADLAISVTGLAGPGGGTAEQPVGLVYIGAAAAGLLRVKRFCFPGGRDMVRAQAAVAAYHWALSLARQLA